MKPSRLWSVLIAVVLIVAVSESGARAAGAAPSSASASTGGPIDLRHGWDDYDHCTVWAEGNVECVTGTSASTARRNQIALSGCPVSLYRGSGYTGQELTLYPEGVWLNLSDFGFDNATVSFIGTGCGFHLAENQWGGGWWYPGYTGPWAATSNMGSSWNYRVSSVYIN